MIRVLQYSVLLVLGLFASQLLENGAWKAWCDHFMMICLAYIMIEVGREFQIDLARVKSYLKDFLVAMLAAVLPWMLCSIYFAYVFTLPWVEALIISCFTAATSAGILFAMLGAAGLTATWVFKKVRILAIFDDLDTILFMIPLQAMLIGFRWELLGVLMVTIAMLVGGYRYMHLLRWPISQGWLLLYSVVLWGAVKLFEHSAELHFTILLPAFCLGWILASSDLPKRPLFDFDPWIKGAFMFLVGLSLAHVEWEGQSMMIATHVMFITLLSNLGKCLPLFFYKNEVRLRERLATCIALFPRGEVGGGVLAFAMAHQLHSLAITISMVSLALNLLLTGFFIYLVKRLLSSPKAA